MATPAGWYPDQTTPETERYWDGTAWTDARRPVVTPEPRGLLSTLTGRLALAVAVLFVLAAAVGTFVPSSVGGESCGTWFNPAWTAEKAEQREAEWDSLVESFEGLGDEENAADARAGAAQASVIYPACSNHLSSRLGGTLVLLVLALLIPGAILFVGGAQRRRL